MSRNRATRPNVIVVFTDQQRWDSTGIHGNPLELTPTFDRVAASGTHVAQAFTPQPVCAPARAAIQTGRYPTTTGCYRNGIPLPDGCRTLADHFGAAGYATGYIGKWHLATDEPVPPEQRGGYRSWLGANVLEFTSDAYRTIVFDEAGDPVMLPGYRSDALFDAAIRFVADHADPPGGSEGVQQPFYLFCSLIEPHHQNEVDSYPAPVGYEERYQGRWLPPDLATLAGEENTAYRHIGGYYGQIRRVDEGFGRLLDALRSMDLLENTIVAFTSDHGCHFKTRNSEYKRSCHDGSIRVPMALCGPGFDGGGRIDRPVSTIDLPPTLLDAAGVGVPSEMQGRSILPLLAEPAGTAAGAWPEEVFIQVSESEVGRAIRTERWKYYVIAPDANPWDDGAADRYVEAELYDLAHDPYELHNLAGHASHREIADELRERLLRRMAEAGEREPVIERLMHDAEMSAALRADPGVHTAGWKPVRFGHQPRRG
ncbi:sulfatase-like hydrolase/transferase [Phytoactinopolyspora halotolerans]|uniref:Sulfatase-like hydrolase/transferase n=1 Tax=Phytoactinopolyspora halotolerans TaxID=1981512 RepID=A0A6L9SBZ5_9ACTN|nr:sulfatase-like hydrolase/transferase [Phytoactinopolyspora halotolerans]NEE02885.1 sulfatase-like hydrolase/transferase [Phytoactinopolyspora halotolerans]